MSGHSKWANIQHRKGRQDAKRSNLWTKLVREIMVAARNGADPDSNSRLRLALLKARAGNVPKDTIKNAILKGSGQLEGVKFEEARYEGYGVGGAALIIDAATDNRTRTVADVRHILSKNGGNLGQNGSVGWMFTKKGVIVIDKEEYDEDRLMETVMEAPIEDFVTEESVYEIYTAPDEDFRTTRDFLRDKDYTFISAEEEQVPSSYSSIDSEEAKDKMQRLLDMLEDDDDVQNVYHNWDEE